MNGQVSEGASEGLFPASEPSLVSEPSLPGGCVSCSLPVTSRIAFQKLILKKTSWAQGGCISVSLSLGGGERRRGGEGGAVGGMGQASESN